MQEQAIKKVLVIGRGEIHDGRNKTLDCEEIQSCIAIIEEHYQPILLTEVSSEPLLDAVLDIPIYQLPLTESFISEIIEKENPQAVFAPFVESSGWRLVQRLVREGYWQEKGIKVVDENNIKGHSINAHRKIRKAVAAASLRQCRRVEVSSVAEGMKIPETLGGYPVAIRSAEKGLAIVSSPEKLRSQLLLQLEESSEHKILIEEHLSGWKEVTIGILKDRHQEVAVIYTSEKVIPISAHSMHSASVSPIQTLFRNQEQFVIGAALHLAKTLDEFVGYAAIRFALDPETGQTLVLGIDFATDHSTDVSLLSSYPLVKMITKLVFGGSLEQMDILSKPIPRRNNTQKLLFNVPQFNARKMTNGEYLSSAKQNIYSGRNFCEAFHKAWYRERLKHSHFGNGHSNGITLREDLMKPYWDQMHSIYRAFKIGTSVSEIERVTGIDPWFLQQIELLVETEQQLHYKTLSDISKEQWTTLKLFGFRDKHIAEVLNQGGSEEEEVTESFVQQQREYFNVYPSSSCFGCSPDDLIKPNRKIMVLTASSNPKKDALLQVPAFVLGKEAKQMGFDVVLVSSDTTTIPFWMMFADHLYIEQLDWERVYGIYKKEDPSGIFIESDNVLLELEKRFADVGAPIVKVPFEITSQMLSRSRV